MDVAWGLPLPAACRPARPALHADSTLLGSAGELRLMYFLRQCTADVIQLGQQACVQACKLPQLEAIHTGVIPSMKGTHVLPDRALPSVSHQGWTPAAWSAGRSSPLACTLQQSRSNHTQDARVCHREGHGEGHTCCLVAHCPV